MRKEDDKIKTLVGEFSREKFRALLNVRNMALESIKKELKKQDYKEVTTSSLVNIAGSCENPYVSFEVPGFYGRKAFLSQSAQLQLEALVVRLKEKVFTVNNSFREENYDDPEAKGRRLSEFTLIEPEKPFSPAVDPSSALNELISIIEKTIKNSAKSCLSHVSEDIGVLGGNLDYLEEIPKIQFEVITYDEALDLLKNKGIPLKFGDDLGIKEERIILEYHGNCPVFVTHHPASIKFFNMKRTANGKRCYSVDLLTPKLGETVGGAIREEDKDKILKQLLESKMAQYCKEKGWDPKNIFAEYFRMLKEERATARGGFGIGFERYVAFLIGSNDILHTIGHRTFTP